MTDTLGSLIIDLSSMELTPEEQELLAHPLVGGVVLFSRNYDSLMQLKSLCKHIRMARKKPLLIMVDQEGGRVQRFINEFTRIPYMSVFGDLYDENKQAACEAAQDCGWLMASELLAAGIDFSLAPVLDLNKGISSIIGQRAFHKDPHVVAQLAIAFIQGMREAGMAATGKHFPGHGSVSLDSHIAMPADERSLAEIEREDLKTFAELIPAGISAIMAAHIRFPNIDNFAVGFSRFWLQDILRSRLGFTGSILSDDLTMEGANISTDYSDRVIAAREAGCDFALLCNNRNGVIQVLDRLQHQAHQIGMEKWGALQGNFSRVKEPLEENSRWLKTHKQLLTMSQNKVHT